MTLEKIKGLYGYSHTERRGTGIRSLIEHKSDVDYNVVMQIFRYMAFIWEDYAKEQNRAHKGISRTKNLYLEKVTAKTPEYLLGIMEQVIEILLRRINVPQAEAAEFAEQVKERKMGELFANFEAYDVQATRAEERKKNIEEAIEKLIKVLRNLNVEEEIIKTQLKEQYNLTEEETAQKVALYK